MAKAQASHELRQDVSYLNKESIRECALVIPSEDEGSVHHLLKCFSEP